MKHNSAVLNERVLQERLKLVTVEKDKLERLMNQRVKQLGFDHEGSITTLD